MPVGIYVFAGLFLFFGELFVEEMLTGWTISFSNYNLQLGINKYGRSKITEECFIKNCGLNGLRVVLFLIVTFIFLLVGDLNTTPFIYSLFGTYFILSLFYILRLNFTS